MIVLIDNYDSFTFNLYQYLSEFTEVLVFRNDEITPEKLETMDIKGIVISPGPGRPENAGNTVDIIKKFKDKVPILGICLGHQAIAIANGGNVVAAKEIVHGKASKIKIKNSGIFEGIGKKIECMRYHSLVVEKDTLPKSLEVIGETLDGEYIMAIKDKKFKVFGLQFHPESVYTEKGKRIIRNFVEVICNDDK